MNIYAQVALQNLSAIPSTHRISTGPVGTPQRSVSAPQVSSVPFPPPPVAIRVLPEGTQATAVSSSDVRQTAGADSHGTNDAPAIKTAADAVSASLSIPDPIAAAPSDTNAAAASEDLETINSLGRCARLCWL